MEIKEQAKQQFVLYVLSSATVALLIYIANFVVEVPLIKKDISDLKKIMDENKCEHEKINSSQTEIIRNQTVLKVQIDILNQLHKIPSYSRNYNKAEKETKEMSLSL